MGPGVGPGGEHPLSRQVFIVQELEVRDRLASSQINKFLYLYTSESMPRRAHSNMVRQQRGEEGGYIDRVIDMILIVRFLFFVADSESPAGVSGVWPGWSRVLSSYQPAATKAQHRPGNSSRLLTARVIQSPST